MQDKQGFEKFSPLKICLLGYRSNPYGGGQGIYLKYLSKALRDLGHTVDVISGQPYPELDQGVRLIKLPGLNLYETGLSSVSWRDFLSWINIVEWFSKLTGGFGEPYCFGQRVRKYLLKYGGEYDVIHDNQSLSYGVAKLQHDFPVVMTIHHPITRDLRIALKAAETDAEKKWINRWYSFLKMQKKVAQQLTSIVTVSELSRQDIANDFDIPVDRISVLYNGIDVDTFKPMPEFSRMPLQLMVTASADQPMKGLEFLLRAYAQLLLSYPALELLVIGKLKKGGDTDKLLSALKLKDRVTFLDGITSQEIVQCYAQATVVVVPSLYEGFGLPAGEAMSCEAPLVSTRGGALPEVVGNAGVLVEAGNSQALVVAIDELLKNPSERERLGKLGREHIINNFSWSKVAIDLDVYYRQVIVNFEQSRADT